MEATPIALRLQNHMLLGEAFPQKQGEYMARQTYYLFCRYSIDSEEGPLDEAGEFAFLSENQGGEHGHGRERDGVVPQTLCTDPKHFQHDGRRVHIFDIGLKPGVRYRQQYDPATKAVVRNLERDPHTKLGQIITVPSIGAMALMDRASDDTISAYKSISALKSFVCGASDDERSLNVIHATNDDVERALNNWRVTEYSYTVRPLNPTGGALARMRTEMYRTENIYQESGKVTAPPGEGLRIGEGTVGQTHDLVESGYGQSGLKGITEDGQTASIPKLPFSQDKEKNIRSQENAPRFIRIAFKREAADDNIELEVAGALMRFYARDEA